jgi:hypothetical protein
LRLCPILGNAHDIAGGRGGERGIVSAGSVTDEYGVDVVRGESGRYNSRCWRLRVSCLMEVPFGDAIGGSERYGGSNPSKRECGKDDGKDDDDDDDDDDEDEEDEEDEEELLGDEGERDDETDPISLVIVSLAISNVSIMLLAVRDAMTLLGLL